MHELNAQLSQLPEFLHSEIAAHTGQTAGLPLAHIIARYRDSAAQLIAQKQANYRPAPPNDILAGHRATREELQQTVDLRGLPTIIPNPFEESLQAHITAESIRFLNLFINGLSSIIARLADEERQRQAAELLAKRQDEEAALQLAQRQAEEAARLHAQHQAAEAARQLAQRQTEEAAQLAARQLAQQQAETAARALARHRAEEAALEEMRLALELKPASGSQAVQAPAVISKESPPKTSDAHPAKEIVFIPGPAAMAEIGRATLVLKHSIDAAVVQYASAIGPYLNTSPVPAATAR
ncbi:hypothetical protein [Pseudomonas abietaniphila]